MVTLFRRASLFLGSLSCALVARAQTNVATYHNDGARTGQNTTETTLTQALLRSGRFGLLFSQPVDGQLYGQPLLASGISINGVKHNVVYVATEHNSVYAFDAATNTGTGANPLWKVSFINVAAGITTFSFPADVPCGDVGPEVGVTSTPVIDLASQTLYVVANTKENGTFYQRLHALDLASGAEKFGGPVAIQASIFGSGDGSVNGLLAFNPLQELQRTGLLLQGGAVYIAWASHCDQDPYHGWVMAYDSQTLAQLGVWNSTPNGSRGGIWQSGAGLAGDGSSVFVATGNGTADLVNGAGDSVIRLGLDAASSQITEMDEFTAFNMELINEDDADLGSGGVLLLPTLASGSALAVAGGKEGRVYLLDRANLGGYNMTADQVVQEQLGNVGPIFGAEAYWNSNVYFGAVFDSVKAFSFNSGGSGVLSLGATSLTDQIFGYPGTTVSVSSNGTAEGILWALDVSNWKAGGTAILHAYDATDLTSEFWNSGERGPLDSPGPAIKFSVPTVANGHVYVGTATQLAVFGEIAAATVNCADLKGHRGTVTTAGTLKTCPEN